MMFNSTSKAWLVAASMLLLQGPGFASDSDVFELSLPGGDVADIRLFKSDQSERLLLGFACDQGTGQAEMNTASILSGSSMEIWMPDLLSAHFLPKVQSSLDEIPAEDVVVLVDAAIASSDKKVYLISSGMGSKLLLRGLAQWERENPGRLDALSGVILLYPRLNAAPPEPGKEPVYIDAVGKTRTPILVLEGSKTPNSWALSHLRPKLEAGGSPESTSLIPGVRGFFYERDTQTLPEDIVSSQLAGLVRASVVKLDLFTRKLNKSREDS